MACVYGMCKRSFIDIYLKQTKKTLTLFEKQVINLVYHSGN